MSERPGGGFDPFGIAELGVTRCFGAELAEVFHFIQGQRTARKVQPRVQKHRSVAAGKDEAVAVQPFGRSRIVAQSAVAEQHRADFCTAEWQAEVAGVAGVDCVDRKSPSLGSGLSENGVVGCVRRCHKSVRVGAVRAVSDTKRGCLRWLACFEWKE